jgi:hypothetical protein
VETAGGAQVYYRWYTPDQVGCEGDLECAVTPVGINLTNGEYRWHILDYGAYGYGSYTPFMNFELNAVCYSLTTDVLPAGSGTVNVTTPNCGSGYTSGTLVQVRAVANSGYVFSNWSGAGSGSVNPVYVLMDGDKSMIANFKNTTVLISPSGEQTEWDGSFHWNGIAEATHYLLEVETAGGAQVYYRWYTPDQVGCEGDLECAVTPVGINLTNGEYRWHILDYGAYGYGSYTPFMNFELNQ